jgi:hypothetical protein
MTTVKKRRTKKRRTRKLTHRVRSRRQIRRRSLKGTSHDIGFISRRRRLSRKRKSRKRKSRKRKSRRVRSSKGKQRGGGGTPLLAGLPDSGGADDNGDDSWEGAALPVEEAPKSRLSSLAGWMSDVGHGRSRYLRKSCEQDFKMIIKRTFTQPIVAFFEKIHDSKSEVSLDEILKKIIHSCKKGYFGNRLQNMCEGRYEGLDLSNIKFPLVLEMYENLTNFMLTACAGQTSRCSPHQEAVKTEVVNFINWAAAEENLKQI